MSREYINNFTHFLLLYFCAHFEYWLLGFHFSFVVMINQPLLENVFITNEIRILTQDVEKCSFCVLIQDWSAQFLKGDKGQFECLFCEIWCELICGVNCQIKRYMISAHQVQKFSGGKLNQNDELVLLIFFSNLCILFKVIPTMLQLCQHNYFLLFFFLVRFRLFLFI